MSLIKALSGKEFKDFNKFVLISFATLSASVSGIPCLERLIVIVLKELSSRIARLYSPAVTVEFFLFSCPFISLGISNPTAVYRFSLPKPSFLNCSETFVPEICLWSTACPNTKFDLVGFFLAFILARSAAFLAANASLVSVNADLPKIRSFTALGLVLRTCDEGPLRSIFGWNCGELANGCAFPVPVPNAWSLPLSNASIIGWTCGFCAMSVGITASPGISTAGTLSLLPVPGTDAVPLANFFGAPPLPGTIIPGFVLAKLAAATVASIYAWRSALTADASILNCCVSLLCAWFNDAATVAASSCSTDK